MGWEPAGRGDQEGEEKRDNYLTNFVSTKYIEKELFSW